jgi:branched-chain amino acid transport system substrate-binding protein
MTRTRISCVILPTLVIRTLIARTLTVPTLLVPALLVPILILLGLSPAAAEKRYGPGVSDTEIKIGNTNPYSGNASAYGQNGRAEAAYYRMINDQGGVNGRRIVFISLDDSYSPPKTVELTRQLVERDQVLLVAAPLGTAPNIAIQKYLNQKKVPQLFVGSGASRWDDPKTNPWTIGWNPSYHTEGYLYAKHMLANVKDPKVAILRQNDDVGMDYLNGFLEGLGSDNTKLIAEIASYEVTDPTVDSQMLQLKRTGANVFVNITTPKFAAQAIKKAGEIGWKPVQYLVNVAASVGAVMRPAGLDHAQGILTADYKKDTTDPRWQDDAEMKEWRAWMDKYQPTANQAESANVTGYASAWGIVHVLRNCGDDLTRENVMRQAASLHAVRVPMLLPGITVNTGPDDFAPMKSLQFARFEGDHWVLFGELMTRGAD